ncbi:MULTISPECIES: hypothetical protein [unclassified Campylobacter]|uniref:hypothetical protein n=1 Tax=unclassified Campylobacter TaxID=2593542 RepID=UPI0022EA0FDF|nr:MULTISPECIES: hypothetical protein [unclassified Campylobacter]MDA3055160.1 hypothetical protein [Campylobacter sp. VBCF_07 NA4]MDA3070929.1 hypothetical protein [Campylobacter sp. VBCF_08 NA3]WBR54070.1 hypothetical protein PF027_07040 [Campylobacter sp. VBCF_01 NA2]
MRDKNIKLKKKLFRILITIIVVLPFAFVYIKHENSQPKESKDTTIKQVELPRPQAQPSPRPQVQPEPKPAPQSTPKPRIVGDENEIFFYKSDFANNVVDVFADARRLKLSHDGKRLFSYGINRDGFMIIDVSNPKKIAPIGIYKYPKARYFVNNIDIAESRDGKRLYVADPHNGILYFDISNPAHITLISALPLEVPLKIKLSRDDKIAFAKTTKGFFTIDISGSEMKILDEFVSDTSDSDNEEQLGAIRPRGDFDFLSENEILFINFNEMHIFDVSDPKNIKSKYRSYDFNWIQGGKYQMMHDFKIAKNNTRLYTSTMEGFRIYDISDIKNIKFLGEYLSNGNLTARTMTIDENANLAYLGWDSKTEEGKFARIEIVDLSYELDPMLIKSYNMPESHDLFAVPSQDKKYLFLQAEPGSGGYGDYVSVVEK